MENHKILLRPVRILNVRARQSLTLRERQANHTEGEMLPKTVFINPHGPATTLRSVGLNNFEYNGIDTMSSDEEQTRVKLVIREQIKAVEEKMEEKVEKIVESTGIDASSVEPVISEVTSATTTVIASGIKELTQALGLLSISESSLTDEQKKLATQIYDSTKTAILSFINDASLNNTVKITKTLGQVIKQLESVQVDGKASSGADKKAVAIQLGHILIKEVMPDDKGEAEVLVMYDLVAEPTLEAMIEVSRVVNVAVQELATKCCPGLLEFFKRVKKTA